MKDNTYKLSIENRMTSLETKMNLLIENHIPHLDEKLDRILEGNISQKEWEEHLKKDEDHEHRIRTLEKYGWIAIGGLYVINALIGYYIVYKSYH